MSDLEPLSDEHRRAATALLASHDSAEWTATRAQQLIEDLLQHFARLVGEVEMMALFKRAVRLASDRAPALAAVGASEPSQLLAALRTALAHQPPAVIVDALAIVLSNFACLLHKLLGESLVRQLLEEVLEMRHSQQHYNASKISRQI